MWGGKRECFFPIKCTLPVVLLDNRNENVNWNIKIFFTLHIYRNYIVVTFFLWLSTEGACCFMDMWTVNLFNKKT